MYELDSFIYNNKSALVIAHNLRSGTFLLCPSSSMGRFVWRWLLQSIRWIACFDSCYQIQNGRVEGLLLKRHLKNICMIVTDPTKVYVCLRDCPLWLLYQHIRNKSFKCSLLKYWRKIDCILLIGSEKRKENKKKLYETHFHKHYSIATKSYFC